MKKISLLIMFAMLTVAITTSCRKENSSVNLESKKDLLDLCFVARGTNGELIDLHIQENENKQFTVTTSPSLEKTITEEIPEYIVISEGVKFIDNSMILPETNEKYWIFEVTLEAPIMQKSNPGGTITADCNCLAGQGSCRIHYTMYNHV